MSLTQSLITHRSNSPLYNGIIADVLSGFFDVFLFYRPILVQQTKPTAVLCLTARFIYVRMIYFSERHLEFNGKCCTHHIGVITTCRWQSMIVSTRSNHSVARCGSDEGGKFSAAHIFRNPKTLTCLWQISSGVFFCVPAASLIWTWSYEVSLLKSL